jgi:hypothetical protein
MNGPTTSGRDPGDDPTHRLPEDADPTRRSAPVEEWEQPWVLDQPPPPPPPGPAPTRPVQPDPSDTAALDTTRALEEPWEGTAQPYTTGAGEQPDGDSVDAVEVEEQPRRRRGRDVALLLVGSVLGFLLAFLVVAWSTSGEQTTEDGDTAALQEQVVALEEQLGALEAERDDALARTDDLEAQLAEAEAAAGVRDEDIEAQRQALDERAAALDDRAGAQDAREDQLDDRDAALNDRAAALDQREQELDAREQELDDAGTPTEGGGETEPADGEGGGEGDGGGGIDLPDLPEIDTDEVGNIVERALDWLRDLF